MDITSAMDCDKDFEVAQPPLPTSEGGCGPGPAGPLAGLRSLSLAPPGARPGADGAGPNLAHIPTPMQQQPTHISSPAPDPHGCARALAAALPSLTHIRFTPEPPEERDERSASADPDGRPPRNCRSAPQRILAPLPLLLHLAAHLGADSGQAGDAEPHFAGAASNGCGGAAEAGPDRGLRALTVDYGVRSADPYEAEILTTPDTVLLLDWHAAAASPIGTSVAGESASCAAPATSPYRPASARSRASRPAPTSLPTRQLAGRAPDPHPLLALTALEVRGVLVAPSFLSGLRHLSALRRLTLSVSCARPYEPLVGSLPHLRALTHLHLFLHAPPHDAHGASLRDPEAAAAAAAAGYGRGGGSGGGAPDLTPVDLAAAVSQCGRLVSLGLPGEELDGQMPQLLQALPGLTHLEARQLAPWALAGPHTALASLSLTMAWPRLLAGLLPSLPRLRALRADLYAYAEGGGGGGDGKNGGGGSRKPKDAGRADRKHRGEHGHGHGHGQAGGRREWGARERAEAPRGAGERRLRREDWEERADADLYAAAAGGGGTGGGGGYTVGDLYEHLSELAAALEGCDVRAVRLQLSVMRPEGWDWALLLRSLAAVPRLRGLALRMPQPDSGPQLRAQHLVNVCRGMRGLRRLTLLLGGPACARLNAKALQALQYLPHLQSVQLHLAGGWEGGAAGEGAGRGRGFGGPKAREGRPAKGAASGANGVQGDALAASAGDGGEEGCHASARQWWEVPEPYSAAARAVLDAARGLGRARAVWARAGTAGGGARRVAWSGQQGGSAEEVTSAEEDTGSSGDEGGGSTDCEGSLSEDSEGGEGEGEDEVAGGAAGSSGAGARAAAEGPGRGWGGAAGPGSRGASGGGAACGSRGRARAPIRLQVDFLTRREVAAINAALRMELRPVVVEAGLRPGWRWAQWRHASRVG